MSRRAEYAEMTRQSIIDTARRLFAEQGYTTPTVDQIAREARVASKTVYMTTGGKKGLLRTVVASLSEAAEVDTSLEAMRALT